MPRSRKPSSEYEVGYGKPPQHTRFKPGQSGNRKGRPKGTRNIKTILENLAGETITVRENGKSRTLNGLELMLRMNWNKAMKGDPRAFACQLSLMAQHGVGLPEETHAAAPLSLDDQALIQRRLALLLKNAGEKS